MTSRSENNLTEILDRLAQKWAAGHEPPVEWENLDMVQRQRIKQELLPTVMLVLDIEDEIDAERSTEEALQAAAGVAYEHDGDALDGGGRYDWTVAFKSGWKGALNR